MGIRAIVLCLLMIAAISCSKQAQESISTNDSTANQTLQNDGQPKEMFLSAEERDRLNVLLFLTFHDGELMDLVEGSYVVYKEESLPASGNNFSYEIQIYHTNPTINQVDTIRVSGSYVVYPPDATKHPGKIQCVFAAQRDHVNARFLNAAGELTPVVNLSNVPTLEYDIRGPFVFSREGLHLKCKMMALTDEDLAGLSKDELGYLRNEIFARHGHTFKTEKMLTYFNAKKWYRAIVDDATPLLNSFEKKNVEFIKTKEE